MKKLLISSLAQTDALAKLLMEKVLITREEFYWEMRNWGAEELTFKDHNLSLCKVESLRVDRKSKLVTYINAPKRPQPDSCKGMENDPIVSHMVVAISFGLTELNTSEVARRVGISTSGVSKILTRTLSS